MLDFLNQKEDQSWKPSLQRKPYIDQGISIEAPQQFQKRHTLISRNTFVNPYLSYEEGRKQQIPQSKYQSIEPRWTRKVDLNQIQTEQTFLRNMYVLEKLKPEGRYRKQLSESKTRFRLVKGQFEGYLQRNNSNKLFGPLIGKERTSNKSLLTKKQIAQKSFYNLSRNTEKLKSYTSRKSFNKSPLDLKYNMQKTRFSFRQNFKKELEGRKTMRQTQFLLPHLDHNESFANSIDYENSEKSLLNNKSIEKLHDLKEFTHMKKFYTIDHPTMSSKRQLLEKKHVQ